MNLWLVLLGSGLVLLLDNAVNANERDALNDLELRRFVRKLVRAALLEASEAKDSVPKEKKCGPQARHLKPFHGVGESEPCPPPPRPPPPRPPPPLPPSPIPPFKRSLPMPLRRRQGGFRKKTS